MQLQADNLRADQKYFHALPKRCVFSRTPRQSAALRELSSSRSRAKRENSANRILSLSLSHSSTLIQIYTLQYITPKSCAWRYIDVNLHIHKHTYLHVSRHETEIIVSFNSASRMFFSASRMFFLLVRLPVMINLRQKEKTGANQEPSFRCSFCLCLRFAVAILATAGRKYPP